MEKTGTALADVTHPCGAYKGERSFRWDDSDAILLAPQCEFQSRRIVRFVNVESSLITFYYVFYCDSFRRFSDLCVRI